MVMPRSFFTEVRRRLTVSIFLNSQYMQGFTFTRHEARNYVYYADGRLKLQCSYAALATVPIVPCFG